MDPFDGLVQDCTNSIANAMELLQSYTKPSNSSKAGGAYMYMNLVSARSIFFASLAFVRGIHRGRVNSPHKGPVTRKMNPVACLQP